MSNELKPTAIIIRKLSRVNCRPCAVLTYALNDIADQLTAVNAQVSEHDIDVEFGLIRKYGITSVPTLIFERNGAEITRLNGLVSTAEILDAVEYAKVAR